MRFALVRSVPTNIVPVRSLPDRSTPVNIVPERFFPFSNFIERSVPAKLTLERSVRSNKFELLKFANTNLAPSIFVFLKLVFLRSALSKTAFCRFKLSKFLPDKSALTAYTTPVPDSLLPKFKLLFHTEYVCPK